MPLFHKLIFSSVVAVSTIVGAAISLAQETPTVVDSVIAEALERLSSDRFSTRQRAFDRLLAQGAAAIAAVESSAVSGDLDHDQRCVEIIAGIAQDEESREAALQALDRLAATESVPAAQLARKFAFDLRETKQERAIRLLTAAGVRLHRSGSNDTIRYVSGITRDRLCKYLKHLPEVSSLTVSGPGITNQCFSHLAGMPKLESLTIMRCSVSDAGLKQLPKIRSLERVSLSGDFSSVGLHHLSKVNELSSVAIFDSVGAEELSVLSKLSIRSLFLGGLEMSGEAAEQLAQIDGIGSFTTSLKEVSNEDLEWVSRTKLSSISLTIEYSPNFTDEGLVHLQNEKIRTLRLKKTGITDSALEELAKIDSLSSLSIYDSPITDDGLMKMKEMRKLRSLTLMNTKVTDDGMLALKEAMPTLRYARNNRGLIAPKPAAPPAPKPVPPAPKPEK